MLFSLVLLLLVSVLLFSTSLSITIPNSLRKYIGCNNFILSCNHPAYYARKRINMPSSIFITISKLVKDYFNEDIKWYNEVEL